MQILVVVADIRVRTSKADVEKGSATTVFGSGLLGPKRQANALCRCVSYFKGKLIFLIAILRHTYRKGNRLIVL